MKKIKSFIIIPILLGFVLNSCQQNEDEVRIAATRANPAEKKLMKNLMDNLKKANPEIEVTFQAIPGNYNEKIQLMLGTGTAPNIFYLQDFRIPSFLQYDKIRPLNDLIKKDSTFDVEDFYPQFIEAFTKEGEIYGIPKDFGAFVLYYNKKMFEEAGLKRPPKDWKELEAFAKKLTKDQNGDGKLEQYGLVVEPAIDKFIVFAYQNGSAYHDEEGNLQLTSPEFIEALEFYHGMYEKKIATIPSDISMQSSEEAFGRERVAMVISGSWFIPSLRDNYAAVDYGIAELPQGKEKATLTFTVGYLMPNDVSKIEDSWKTLAYLTGKEGMKVWTSSGVAMPTRKSVAKVLGYDEHPVYSVFMKSAEYGHVFQVDYNDRWFDVTQAGLQGIFLEGLDIRETLEAIEKEVKPLKLKP